MSFNWEMLPKTVLWINVVSEVRSDSISVLCDQLQDDWCWLKHYTMNAICSLKEYNVWWIKSTAYLRREVHPDEPEDENTDSQRNCWTCESVLTAARGVRDGGGGFIRLAVTLFSVWKPKKQNLFSRLLQPDVLQGLRPFRADSEIFNELLSASRGENSWNHRWN